MAEDSSINPPTSEPTTPIDGCPCDNSIELVIPGLAQWLASRLGGRVTELARILDDNGQSNQVSFEFCCAIGGSEKLVCIQFSEYRGAERPL